MRILGIETSCDETSAAVVEETGDAARPWAIRSNVVASQVPIHREWGGVVPELASRQHIRDICGVVERALDDSADVADMLTRCQLRHDAAPLPMNRPLRRDDVRSDGPGPRRVAGLLDDGRRRFVAGGFDAEDSHICRSLKPRAPEREPSRERHLDRKCTRLN